MDSNEQFSSLMKVGFTYNLELRDACGKVLAKQTFHNIFVTEGMNYMLDVALGTRAKITTFYLGLFEANYTPITTDTISSFPGSSTETTAYTQSTRVAFTPNAVSSATITNIGLEAQFTFSADKTVYGAFTASSAAKGATTGVLLSAAKFGSPQVAKAGNVLYLQAGCELVNV